MSTPTDRRLLARVIDWSIAHRGAVLIATALLSLAGVWAVLRTPVDAIRHAEPGVTGGGVVVLR